MTYNQAPYIRQCLDGLIRQVTNFSFFAFVHDDCSTDGTADIVKEYADKYPDKIFAIYEEKNQYSSEDDCRGELLKIICRDIPYMAICEGDDYWTDPYKLQKQVDYMEMHSECAICFHPVMVLNQNTGEIAPDMLKDVPSETTICDLARIGNYIHTPSVMYRYNPRVIEKMSQLGKLGVGDYLSHILYAENGSICKLPDYMAVYRQGVGVWSGNKVPYRTEIQWLIAISKLFPLLENKEAKKYLDEQIDTYARSILKGVHEANNEAIAARSSKAYRLGKLLLKPFRWMKKK